MAIVHRFSSEDPQIKGWLTPFEYGPITRESTLEELGINVGDYQLLGFDVYGDWDLNLAEAYSIIPLEEYNGT